MTSFIVIVITTITIIVITGLLFYIYDKKLTCPRCKHVRKHPYEMIWFCPKNDKFVNATEDISECKFKDIKTNVK